MVGIVTLARAKSHVRIEGPADDELLHEYIQVATEWVADYTGRVLTPPKNRLERYPPFARRCEPIQLRHRDVPSVTGINYYNEVGRLVSLSPNNFRVVEVPRNRYKQIIPGRDIDWPSCDTTRPDTVLITAMIGTPPADIPEHFKHAILLMIGEYYEHRTATAKPPAAIENLLARDRPFQ